MPGADRSGGAGYDIGLIPVIELRVMRKLWVTKRGRVLQAFGFGLNTARQLLPGAGEELPCFGREYSKLFYTVIKISVEVRRQIQ